MQFGNEADTDLLYNFIRRDKGSHSDQECLPEVVPQVAGGVQV